MVDDSTTSLSLAVYFSHFRIVYFDMRLLFHHLRPTTGNTASHMGWLGWLERWLTMEHNISFWRNRQHTNTGRNNAAYNVLSQKNQSILTKVLRGLCVCHKSYCDIHGHSRRNTVHRYNYHVHKTFGCPRKLMKICRDIKQIKLNQSLASLAISYAHIVQIDWIVLNIFEITFWKLSRLMSKWHST